VATTEERSNGRATLDIVGPPAPPGGAPARPPATPARPARPRRGRLGVLLLGLGLAGMVTVLALQATSITQAVALAIPVVLVGAGLSRIGRTSGVAGLRSLGTLLILVALAGPLIVAATPPASMDRTTVGGAVPAKAAEGLLRASLGSGQVKLGAGGPGLFEADLRSSGRSSSGVTTSGSTVVVELRAPSQRGLLARNRGSDWTASVTPALPWRVELEGGAVTGDLDLRRLNVRSTRVDAGLGRLALRLGPPNGRTAVDVHLTGGLLDLYLPRDAGLELTVEGPVVRDMGGRRLERTGGVWRTPGAAPARAYVVRADLGTGVLRLHWS
jgi:hypothetical protein